MPAYHNGKSLKAYHNGRSLKAYQNGKLILGGIIALDVNPISLTFEGENSGSSNAKTATITGGKSPYSFGDTVPNWLSVTINQQTGIITVYPTSQNIISERTWDTTIVDSKGNTVPFSVVQKLKITFVIVGGGGNINFTNDSGKTWT
jgi:hypothetical protein